ncbi:MAG TPA: gluconokinase [Anaerolineales bacterium]|nr:gluconokinase [Anaerolineales bacterium]
MGVSGSGKSTLGPALALELGWDFYDADDFHPAANIAKMASGVPLTDADREPWLDSLNQKLVATLEVNRHPILACSALREKYRQRLFQNVDGMAILYLRGSYETIRTRLAAREGHFMKETLLQSQFEALEEPPDALILDVSMPVHVMLDTILTNYPLVKRP